MISYNPLWRTLINKNMKKTDLIELIGLSSATISKMGKNEYIALNVIEKICIALDCNIEDVVEIKKEE
ncbi:TPA: helix-turn-helix domain-containing protein [Clostridioides difficile]|uniref:helix-turn-helix domain-containing protein n=1 Tax=Clostridioides difficile TaxID=1496 RepID=UPI00093B2BE8|nr:helix-turn-helix domain-containing protein [Clostridioides difficile]EJX3465330.1 helix-turn-helix domain-containing protein [Clostridioides difficile]EKS6825007.1 helix-turn-helix domain-containing protein [Clostridioides difficile]ELX4548848.1 helix-turn-helix domain-containing protein [Clostridioides difficile]MCD8634769.1 helix-turn-helix domain-containing protein [Clostridioides difficile]MCE4865442.1 helix-turn-helix domain-containing protein [Clostridioides difficile]